MTDDERQQKRDRFQKILHDLDTITNEFRMLYFAACPAPTHPRQVDDEFIQIVSDIGEVVLGGLLPSLDRILEIKKAYDEHKIGLTPLPPSTETNTPSP